MAATTDNVISTLIKPPRQIFSGFDWSKRDKLTPTGDAFRDRLVSEGLQPKAEPPR